MIDKRLISLMHIVQYGSFTEAARQLSLTQPAISQHIKHLETLYGIKIFDQRMGGNIHITREGEVLLSYAKRVLALSDRLQEQLINDAPTPFLYTVGASKEAESLAAVNALAKYSEENEQFNFKYIVDEKANIIDMLNSFKLDFAFIEGDFDETVYWHEEVEKDSLMLMVSPENDLYSKSKKKVPVEKLKKEKLILTLPGTVIRDSFDKALADAGIDPGDLNITMELDKTPAIKDMVARNLGVAVLPVSECKEEIKKRKLIALKMDGIAIERKISLVYRQEFEYPEIVKGIANAYNFA